MEVLVGVAILTSLYRTDDVCNHYDAFVELVMGVAIIFNNAVDVLSRVGLIVRYYMAYLVQLTIYKPCMLVCITLSAYQSYIKWQDLWSEINIKSTFSFKINIIPL